MRGKVYWKTLFSQVGLCPETVIILCTNIFDLFFVPYYNIYMYIVTIVSVCAYVYCLYSILSGECLKEPNFISLQTRNFFFLLWFVLGNEKESHAYIYLVYLTFSVIVVTCVVKFWDHKTHVIYITFISYYLFCYTYVCVCVCEVRVYYIILQANNF